jgi:hypothetical protein
MPSQNSSSQKDWHEDVFPTADRKCLVPPNKFDRCDHPSALNLSTSIIIIIIIFFFLLLLLLAAIELSLRGSSPYTSANKTNKNKYTKRNNKKAQYKQYKEQ